jgi:hypothetical protein
MPQTDPAIAALARVREADDRYDAASGEGDASAVRALADEVTTLEMAAAETRPATWQGAAAKLQDVAVSLDSGHLAPELAPLVAAIAKRFDGGAPAVDDVANVRMLEAYLSRYVEEWGEHADALAHLSAVRRWAAVPRVVR